MVQNRSQVVQYARQCECLGYLLLVHATCAIAFVDAIVAMSNAMLGGASDTAWPTHRLHLFDTTSLKCNPESFVGLSCEFADVVRREC